MATSTLERLWELHVGRTWLCERRARSALPHQLFTARNLFRSGRCPDRRFHSLYRNQVLHYQGLVRLRDGSAICFYHFLYLALPHRFGEARLHRYVARRMTDQAILAIGLQVRAFRYLERVSRQNDTVNLAGTTSCCLLRRSG